MRQLAQWQIVFSAGQGTMYQMIVTGPTKESAWRCATNAMTPFDAARAKHILTRKYVSLSNSRKEFNQ